MYKNSEIVPDFTNVLIMQGNFLPEQCFNSWRALKNRKRIDEARWQFECKRKKRVEKLKN